MTKETKLFMIIALAALQLTPSGYAANYTYENYSAGPTQTQTPEQSQQSYSQPYNLPSGGIYPGGALNNTRLSAPDNSLPAMKERAKRVVDTNRNGRLSLEETATSLLTFNQTYLKPVGSRNYNGAYDFDRNGRVDASDRNVLWQLAMDHQTTSAIKAVTNIDRDSNGIISNQEASETIAGFMESFDKYPGQRGFNYYYDYNNDRRVNSSDVPALEAVLPGQFSIPSSTPPVTPTTPEPPAPTNNTTPPVSGPTTTNNTTPPVTPATPEPPAPTNNTTPPVSGPATTNNTTPPVTPATPEPPAPEPANDALQLIVNTTPPATDPTPTQTTPPASPPTLAPARPAPATPPTPPPPPAATQDTTIPSRESNAPLTKEEKVERQVDTNRDGIISLEEMAKALLDFQKTYGKRLGKTNYNAAFDFDGNNRVNSRDRSLLHNLARNSGTYHLTKVIREVDRNRNNEISDKEAEDATTKFLAAFGKRRGQSGYRYSQDFDRNRVVDSADANALSAVIGRDVINPAPVPQEAPNPVIPPPPVAPTPPATPPPAPQNNNSSLSAAQIEAQATIRAQNDLSTHLNEFRTVNLWNFTLHNFNSSHAGVQRYYTARIFGTDKILWGLVDAAGQIIVSGVSETSDNHASAEKITEFLARLWSQDQLNTLFNDMLLLIRSNSERQVSGTAQFFTLKGVLDMVRAKPAILNTISGYPGVLLSPFNVMRKAHMTDEQINYLTNGLMSEFNLNDPSRSRLAAEGHRILASILPSRGASLEEVGRNSAPAYRLLQTLVQNVVQSRPFGNPHFEELLMVVENYHLPRLEVVLPNRRPEVLVTFMQQWLNANKVTDNLDVADRIARIAYEIQFYPMPGNFKNVAQQMYRKIINDMLQAAQRTSNLDTLTRMIQIFVGYGAQRYETQMDRFEFLSTRKQKEIHDLVMRYRYNTNSLDQPSQNDYLVFLSYLYRDNTRLSFWERNNIFRFVNSKLVSRTNDLLRLPVPTEDDFASDYKNKLSVAVIIAKAIDQKKRLNPLLSRFVTRFQGSTSYPAETSQGYTKRLMIVRELWTKGIFIMDQANLFGRDIRLLEHIRDLYDRVGPVAYRVTNVIQSNYREPRRARGSAGSNGVMILYRYIEQAGQDYSEYSWRSGSLLTTVAHELGHLRDYVMSPKNKKAWVDLHGRSDRSSQDDYITNYAKTNSNEDLGETHEDWLIRNKSFFERALENGQTKNKWLLMEKYLFLTRISVEANGSREFTQWAFHAASGSGEEYVFENQGAAVVGPLNAQGMISRIAIGDKSYEFIWSGERLMGVRVTPYRLSYDVNRDGTVSVLDATLIMQETTRIYYGAQPNLRFDANGDGRVTSRDFMNVTNFYSNMNGG